MFLQNVPEFYFLLLAAEKIGASLLCRDNTLDENVDAVAKSGAKTILAHSYLSREEMEEAALKNEKIQALISGKTVVKVICVPGKLVNIVVK